MATSVYSSHSVDILCCHINAKAASSKAESSNHIIITTSSPPSRSAFHTANVSWRSLLAQVRPEQCCATATARVAQAARRDGEAASGMIATSSPDIWPCGVPRDGCVVSWMGLHGSALSAKCIRCERLNADRGEEWYVGVGH